jgi:L-arabinose isomerase
VNWNDLNRNQLAPHLEQSLKELEMKMEKLESLEIWFITGSQHLYGVEALKQVAANSQKIADSLGNEQLIPVKVVYKPVVTTPDEIRNLCREANNTEKCIGLVLWMHTFSPAKMWIAGLSSLAKPFLHLHTQFNRGLPWSSIDMDFIVGFWQDPETIGEIATWIRAAAAWHDSQNLKIARFGDNMRNVAVTEGDKVAAQAQFGYSVSGYGVSDLVARMNEVPDSDVERLVAEYRETYSVAKQHDRPEAFRAAAKIELGLRAFLTEGGFGAFTDTFEDLPGLEQLPGIAVQRLMADGFGFGAEGDWKTAALLRSMKIMAQGLPGGTSFMEDYTYDFTGTPKVLGAHMLEVCPSIAADKPSLEVHPLGIGGKADPPRLVFTAPSGPAIVASLIDMGNRFRMIVNEIEVIQPERDLPKLPVARAVWLPKPSLKVAAAAWIYAGGAHHTSFSQALTTEHLEDFAEIAGIELIRIDQETRIPQFRRELRWNDAAFSFGRQS